MECYGCGNTHISGVMQADDIYVFLCKECVDKFGAEQEKEYEIEHEPEPVIIKERPKEIIVKHQEFKEAEEEPSDYTSPLEGLEQIRHPKKEKETYLKWRVRRRKRHEH